MESLQTWWGIAQLAGAGAAVVLGPVAVLLWRQHLSDTDYIREADKNTLTVLGTLTNHLQNGEKNHEAVLKEINLAVERIVSHIKRAG